VSSASLRSLSGLSEESAKKRHILAPNSIETFVVLVLYSGSVMFR
jgi:hypothetical protein